MAKLRKSKGKANPAEGAKPEVKNAAAAPLQASTSNSTPASIKKKIKKKEKLRKKKETEIAVSKETKALAPAEAPAKLPAKAPAKLPAKAPANLPAKAPAELPTKAPENAEKSSGFIFMCNSRTKPECYQRQIFGLPRGKAKLLERIKPGARLFLYDIELRLLYGIYSAVSAGGINLVPEAFGGAFPAQVKFKIDKDCVPLPERSFKQAILENYDAKNRFEQNLSSNQVHSLELLFQPVSNAPPQTADPHRYLPPARMLPPPEDPYRSGGHLASAHMPPPKDQYRSAGHMVQPHLPLPEDPYRSVGHVVASYLHPAVEYRSGRYLMPHQLPPEDPYGHAYQPRVPIDSRYLSPFAPPPANDPRGPQHLLAAPPPTDPYYPAPASDPYGQVGAGRAYYPENPALSDRFAYRTMAPGALAATEPSLQQRYYMQSSDDANRSYIESIQRQATSTATAAPTGPVSSRYAFPGAAPAHR